MNKVFEYAVITNTSFQNNHVTHPYTIQQSFCSPDPLANRNKAMQLYNNLLIEHHWGVANCEISIHVILKICATTTSCWPIGKLIELANSNSIHHLVNSANIEFLLYKKNKNPLDNETCYISNKEIILPAFFKM